MASARKGWSAGFPISLLRNAKSTPECVRPSIAGRSRVSRSSSRLTVAAVLVVAAAWPLTHCPSARAESLRGSRSSVQTQYDVALQHDFTFIRSSKQLQAFVRKGYLVPIKGNRHYELSGVSYPYGRPAVRTFIERLSAQFQDATGEKLVITSLTRPLNRQPRNASEKSVHPTGMAIDMRIPGTRSGRRWLEDTLMSLERAGVIEATKERHPAHFHVAVFPSAYEAYVSRITRSNRNADMTYRVAQGDTLWSIARRYNITVGDILSANGLRTNEIYPGQNLTIPTD